MSGLSNESPHLQSNEIPKKQGKADQGPFIPLFFLLVARMLRCLESRDSNHRSLAILNRFPIESHVLKPILKVKKSKALTAIRSVFGLAIWVVGLFEITANRWQFEALQTANRNSRRLSWHGSLGADLPAFSAGSLDSEEQHQRCVNWEPQQDHPEEAQQDAICKMSVPWLWNECPPFLANLADRGQFFSRLSCQF